MNKPTFFEVHNWERYQRYDRNKSSPPPWIKVYTAILSDAKMAGLSDAQFGQLVKIWLAACQNRNRLPFDPRAVKKVAMLDDEPDLQLFLKLGLIDLCADCTQSVDNLNADCSAWQSREEAESEKILVSSPNVEDTASGSHPTTRGNGSKRVPYAKIVGILNDVCGTSFSPQAKATQRHIKARWNEGHRLEDFEKVIRGRFEKWGSDPKMVEYLRPQTLFNTKFEAYLQDHDVDETGDWERWAERAERGDDG